MFELQYHFCKLSKFLDFEVSNPIMMTTQIFEHDRPVKVNYSCNLYMKCVSQSLCVGGLVPSSGPLGSD